MTCRPPRDPRSTLVAMRSWEPKEPPKSPTPTGSVETDAPDAEGGVWEHYGPAVLAAILVIVTAGVCSSILNFR